MPQPHLQSQAPHRLRRRGHQSNVSLMRKIAIAVLITLVLFMILKDSRSDINNDNNNNSTATTFNKKVAISHSKTSIKKLKLSNENQFIKTLQECSDIQKCGHHKVTIHHDGNTAVDTIQRIAILSPPSKALEPITQLLKQAIVTYYDNDIRSMNGDIEIIRSTHVPPYGYGKSHGYTKIVRVITSPLLYQVIGSLYELKKNDNQTNNGSSGSSSRLTTIDDEQVKQLLRQIIRWNCRLSHVAAHTTMINLDLTSSISSSTLLPSASSIKRELKDILEKIIVDPERYLEKEHQITHDTQLTNAYKVIDKSTIDIDFLVLFQESLDYFERIYEKASRGSNGSGGSDSSKNQWMTDLSSVLAEELQSTNNLKKWPCLSFWDVTSDQSQEMEDLSKEMAQLISPSCSDPHAECSVKRDKCEERGDAECLS